jgi:osmotically inducible lipoprotein OsmB
LLREAVCALVGERRLRAVADNMTGESAMKHGVVKLSLAVGLLVLGACGESTGDRGLSGAGIGAAAGAVGGALLGAPLEGAAIGAGVGAAAGALTSPSTVDLGKPVWER